MIRQIFTAFFIWFPLVCASNAQMTYDQFLENHIKAMGGAEALENILSVQSKMIIMEDVNPVTNDGTALDGTYMANRDGQMRVDIYVDGNRVFTEALSSMTEGWRQNGEGETVEPLSEDGSKALQKSIHSNLYALHELEGLGYKVEFQGEQTLMEKSYYAVDLTSPLGKFERQFFDKQTYLKAATMDESALHVDVDPTKVLSVSTNTDYKMVGGVMRSFAGEVINVRENKVIQTFELRHIEFNVPQDKSKYHKP